MVRSLGYIKRSNLELKGDVVSYADEVDIIQKRIIDNLYHNPIVICDVSGKNSNVMFELGMRLAFDKTTIIIKDDCTSYSFDTSPIEHLEYPRDLNYTKINTFKEELARKIKTQLEAISQEGAYSPFLKHFGGFTVAKLDEKEVSGQDYVVDSLSEIKQSISYLNYLYRNKSIGNNILRGDFFDDDDAINFCLRVLSALQIDLLKHGLLNKLLQSKIIQSYNVSCKTGHNHLTIKPIEGVNRFDLKHDISEEVRRFRSNE